MHQPNRRKPLLLVISYLVETLGQPHTHGLPGLRCRNHSPAATKPKCQLSHRAINHPADWRAETSSDPREVAGPVNWQAKITILDPALLDYIHNMSDTLDFAQASSHFAWLYSQRASYWTTSSLKVPTKIDFYESI